LPNETVEKVQFSYFLRKIRFENQDLMSQDFQVLGVFDSLNIGLQATANSLRWLSLSTARHEKLPKIV
jgi:hypothetical protein